MIHLYINLDDENVINKRIELLVSYDVKFKTSTSISSPTLMLSSKHERILECNYCYVDEFQRYYFVTDIQINEKNLVTLTTDCDVLESFKDDILNASGNIHTIEPLHNFTESVHFEIPTTITTHESDVALEGSTIILTTIGGAL